MVGPIHVSPGAQEKKMPKVERVKRKVRRGPISLVETLEKDNLVKAKRKKRSEAPDDDDDGEEQILLRGEDLKDSSAKDLAKIEQLSRDVLELDGESAGGDDEAAQTADYGDDLAVYPMGGRLGPLEVDTATDPMMPSAGGFRTLGDMIFEKMQERSREEAEAEKMALFNPSTIELFAKVGAYMAKYRSGKLPKALRFIPNLRNWLDILWLTKPDSWSAHAVAAATPMFISNTPESQARSFMSYVLLPAFLRDLDASNSNGASARLNVHLYEALCKCLHRPSLFFKAIYFPVILAEHGCAYRHAVILSSVVSKESFPSVQAAAAIIKLCQHEPQTNQIYYCILRLLNKKHDLPIPAIRIIAAYFLAAIKRDADYSRADKSSTKSARKGGAAALPVIWHQTLLVFVQRWANVLNAAEKEAFKNLLKVHHHPKISAEIRRQLFDRDQSEFSMAD